MNDVPEPDEVVPASTPRKTSGLAWGCVILFFIVLVVDIVSIQMLGTNSNNTFSKIGPMPETPIQRSGSSHK